MKTYILIGGIGSGKSAVLDMFQDLGAACIDLDDISHEVIEDASIKQRLVDTFGQTILDDNGRIMRRVLASLAFVDDESTQRLETIVQPAVIERAKEVVNQCRDAAYPVAIVEVSAYRGPGGCIDTLVEEADGIILLTSRLNIRLQRLLAKGFDEQDAYNRINRQVPEKDRFAWADYVLTNNGTIDELKDQVLSLWEKIR